MVTAAKKTPAATKGTTDAVAKKPIAKKPVAKKVVAEPKASAKTSTDATLKKTVAKPATPKVKKVVTAKAAAVETKVESKPEKKQPVKKAAAPKTSVLAVSPDHRKHMIATAAYFIAQRRGFSRGYEVQDWITAEMEIDKQLKS
jgi:hypothetical protein